MTPLRSNRTVRRSSRATPGSSTSDISMMIDDGQPELSVAEALAEKIASIRPGMLSAATTRKCQDLLIDVVGLCVTARNEDYVASAINSCGGDGICTAIGHIRTVI